MAAITPAVTTAINAIALKLSQRDPGANATANNNKIQALIRDWPAATRGIIGPGAFDAVRAAMWCNVWLPGLGVDAASIATLRTVFGV